MFVVVERFLSNIIKEYGENPVSTDGGTWYPSQACSRFLKINQHIHSSMEKSIIIERTIQYIKDITKECFDDYFPYRKKNCKLEHVLKQSTGPRGLVIDISRIQNIYEFKLRIKNQNNNYQNR